MKLDFILAKSKVRDVNNDGGIIFLTAENACYFSGLYDLRIFKSEFYHRKMEYVSCRLGYDRSG